MKNLTWFFVGVLGGFIAAHFVSKNPRGQEFLSSVDSSVSGFADAFVSAFQDQEARLQSGKH